MKKALTKVMLVAMMAILPLSFYAQKKQTKPVERYFYLQGAGGLSVNHTDVANYGFIPFVQDGKFVWNDGYVFKNFNVQFGLGYQFSKVVGFNAKFGTGTLGGKKLGQNLQLIGQDNVVYQDVELDKTKYMDGNLNLTFNFFNLFFGYNPRRVFNLNPHIGVGAIRYHAGAVRQMNENSAEIAPALENEAKIALTVPVGAELNFNLGRIVDFFIDYTYNFAVLGLKGANAEDGLDQMTKENDNIAVRQDMYSFVNAGLRFKFNKKPCDIEAMVPSQITMRTNPENLEEKDGKVCFDVIFSIPGEYFEKEAVMNITPTFNYKGGQIELDPVTFVGEKVDGGDYKVNYKNGGEYTKNYCLDFVPETGMESGKLVGSPMIYVYDGNLYTNQEDIMKNAYFVQAGDQVIAEGIKYVAPVKPEPQPEPEPVPVKQFESIGKVFFDYNKSDYRANLKQNKSNVKSMIEQIAANAEIEEVLIKGYASPEGEVTLNSNLSNDRGNTANGQLKLADNLKVTVTPMGADWDGFYELLANSSIKDKDQIANVLKQIKDGNQREQELKNMMKVYPKLQNLLPELRRAEIFVK